MPELSNGSTVVLKASDLCDFTSGSSLMPCTVGDWNDGCAMIFLPCFDVSLYFIENAPASRHRVTFGGYSKFITFPPFHTILPPFSI